MNVQQLQAIAPLAGARIDIFIKALNAAMARVAVNTPLREAGYIAQILHESSNLAKMTENLNYSAALLMKTFNNSRVTRFNEEQAQMYGRTDAHAANQQMIANIAYANRMGNGTVESGDGWRYRGRGPGQLTGKDNYRDCGLALGIDLVAHPDMVAQPDVGCQAFSWFWAEGNKTGESLNVLADAQKWDSISRAVNGGTHGLAEREALSIRALRVLQ